MMDNQEGSTEQSSQGAEQTTFATLYNNSTCRIAAIPLVDGGRFRDIVTGLCTQGDRLGAMMVVPPQDAEGSAGSVAALVFDDEEGSVLALRTPLDPCGRYPALTPAVPSAQAFEREVFENCGFRPDGHPWLKPLRRHSELEVSRNESEDHAFAHSFFRIDGPGIHEVAVGPVHAGVIEPGHFRFQCHGETVLSLEIQLGYQHRGVEKLLTGAPGNRHLAVVESIAGDTSVGHGLAYCSTLEALAGGVEIPLAAQSLRGIALELERLANHVGDLGALCNDVGFLPGASWFGRLRGEFLNLSMDLCGSRFGRGLVRPGGVRFAVSAAMKKDFVKRLDRAERDLKATADIMFDSQSVLSRFEQTGIVSREVAEELGLVGPVARASGCIRDVREDHPYGVYRFACIPVAVAETGDVHARALIRWLEAQRSLTFVREQITVLEDGPLRIEVPKLGSSALGIGLVEGWRGEIVHLATTDSEGRLSAYKVVDPSFHNWFGLGIALRGNEISDFPLCNKSFNLSYAGHDL